MADNVLRLYAVRLINEKFKKMDIQTELQKIHHKFGVSEKANYEIQKLFDKSIKEAITEALRKNAVSVSLPSDPMVLAKYLHDNYEKIAKRTNWETQKNCKVEFEDLPIENKNTMILLAGKMILDFVGNKR